MRNAFPFLLIFLTCIAAQSMAHEGHKRSDFVSEASHIVGTHKPKSRDHSPEAITKAANEFLTSLTATQRKQISHPLGSAERKKWTNLPQRANNGGLALGKCDEKQVGAFCDLLATLLSEQGYAKTCNIMLADDQLLKNGEPRPGFGTEDFFVVLFGKPSATEPWGFQFDGHHLGLNLSIEGAKVTFAPSFIGTQPEVFKIADHEYRPLAGENDVAFKLVNSLSESQKNEAVLSEQRGNLKAGPGNDDVPELPGISCSDLDESQQKMVLELVGFWVNDLPEKLAAKRMSQIEEEMGKTRFGWRGPLKNGSAISYTIQGPTLIIEYAAQDAKASHIHSIYRDPTNPYGKQLAATN